jgi:hypothetical protein
VIEPWMAPEETEHVERVRGPAWEAWDMLVLADLLAEILTR